MIVEKRINSEQDVLHFLEHELFKEEINIENSSKYDFIFLDVLEKCGLPLMIKKIPLPEGQELTDEEFEKVNNILLLLLGASCDAEINSFMSELDEKIVDSVYKLELKRPRKSMMRDNMYNVDMKRLAKRFERKTIPGKHMEDIFTLIMNVVYETKGIDYSKMSDEEYDEFLKSAMPQDYDEMKKEFEQFKDLIKKSADEAGVEIVHKSDTANLHEIK